MLNKIIDFFKKLFNKKIKNDTFDTLTVYINDKKLEKIIAVGVLYNSNTQLASIEITVLGSNTIDVSGLINVKLTEKVFKDNIEKECCIFECKVKLDSMDFGSHEDTEWVSTHYRFKVKEI